ncbi:MAG TPA: insulinase family protein, partial [Caldithrix sp.]|nr:insulinase family protein [Caldithrix sp.]
DIRKTVLDNGLTIVSEAIPSVRSVSVGVFIKTGTRYENKENNGIAHFLEHMVFKGTKKRSAFKIAQSLEEVGGSLNAYTSKELTVYYAHALDSQLSICMNVLSDMLCNSLFRDSDIEKEKLVVMEEISAVRDTPDEYIFDLFQEQLFPNQPIGYPILGTSETVKQFNRGTLLEFWGQHYCPNNIIISAAGNLQHDKLIKLAQKNFHFNNIGTSVCFQRPESAKKIDLEINESVSQSHICAGLEALSYLAEERYNLIAVNAYLGGGMSSKLFQVIREKHGLAYSVYSFVDFYSDTGMLSVYLGTDKKNQNKALKILFRELEKLTKKEISPPKVNKIKAHLKGNLLLGLESSNRRMTRLAKNEIYYGRQIGLKELVSKIDSISPSTLFEISRKIFALDDFNIIKLSPSN